MPPKKCRLRRTLSAASGVQAASVQAASVQAASVQAAAAAGTSMPAVLLRAESFAAPVSPAAGLELLDGGYDRYMTIMGCSQTDRTTPFCAGEIKHSHAATGSSTCASSSKSKQTRLCCNNVPQI
jgi:hypothetical protein